MVGLVEVRQCDVGEIGGQGGGDGVVVRADEGEVGEVRREEGDRVVE